MKVSLNRIFHCCVDYDPPTSEELQQIQVSTCMSNVGKKNHVHLKQESTALHTLISSKSRQAQTSNKLYFPSGATVYLAINKKICEVPELQQLLMRWCFFSLPSRHCTHNLRIGSRPENLTWLWKRGVRSNNA